LKNMGQCSKKSKLNRVSIKVSLGFGLGLVLGLVPSSDLVL